MAPNTGKRCRKLSLSDLKVRLSECVALENTEFVGQSEQNNEVFLVVVVKA